MAQQGAKRMVLVEDSELDNLYEEWEETLPIHGLPWEIYVARIQLKKVAEWGKETCPHDLFGEGTQCFKHACDECWQALKKEVGL